jgi:nucleotide-binding universal stress UspA family protein
MGDTDHALQVLRSVHGEVLVVPDDRPAPAALRRIVVAFDDSAGAHAALARGAHLARAAGAQLALTTIVSAEVDAWWLGATAPVPPASAAEWLEERTRQLDAAGRAALRQVTGVTATCDVLTGSPVGELVHASAGADLLILGSRRWGTVARLALGSVSEPVVRRSACATLVVPLQRHEED